jgi:hypothetical protein
LEKRKSGQDGSSGQGGSGSAGKKSNEPIGAAPPGSDRAYFEALSQARPEDRLEEVGDWRARHSENGIEREEDRTGSFTTEGCKTRREMKAEESCDEELNKLLELGRCLDSITNREDCWRTDPGTHEIWKPTCRDAWIEEHLSIRSKIGTPNLIRLNRVQREYSRVCLENRSKKNIVLKARQLGITSYIAARYFMQTITRPGTLTMLVAHDRLAAEEIFRIVHRFWDNLPENLQKGPLKTSHSSARELVFPRLDSEFTVTSADENSGRGRTIQNLLCTEVSRWGHDAEEALGSLRAALVPDGEIVLESTANGAWGLFYKEWQQAGETGYTQHFFPWWFEESYRSPVGPFFKMTREETELAAAHGLVAEQIVWRRQQRAALRGMAAQEFAEDAVTCFKASGECVFELECVERMIAEAGEPVESQDNGRYAIWLRPEPGRTYLIGVDPAGGGIEGDYSCAEVIDWETAAQCAELHGHFLLGELAERLVRIATQYNGAELAVERNNHGNGVLAHLEHLEYRNVYKQKEQEGWWTSVKSKPRLVENLAAMLVASPETFRSVRLLNECRTFVRTVAGIPGAASGTHDDCVMAMGIALAVRAEGKKGQRLEVRS